MSSLHEAADQVEDDILDPEYAPAPSPRADATTFIITAAEYTHLALRRVGLTLDVLIRDELEDYRKGLEWAMARGSTPERYAEEQEDRAIWDGGRLVALLLPRGSQAVALVVDPDSPAGFRRWADPDASLAEVAA